MIFNIWILSTDGLPYYNFNKHTMRTDGKLLCGFFSAIQSFALESTTANIGKMIIGEYKFTFYVGDNFIAVINSEHKSNDLIINDLLIEIKNKFIQFYGDFLDQSYTDTLKFDDFDTIILDLLKEYELMITCQTCNKIILNEYIKAEFNDEIKYYCCKLCEREESCVEISSKKMEEVKSNWFE